MRLSGCDESVVFDYQGKDDPHAPDSSDHRGYQQTFDFQALGSRRVEADFSGGHLSSDGGSLLLREVDRVTGLCARLALCFSDFRNQRFVEHALPVMLRQRILGIALGYEDLNDHDKLRLDPLLAAMCGREDLLGEERHRAQDKGKAPAGKSTLNRLEPGAQERNLRTQKIQAHPWQIEALQKIIPAIHERFGRHVQIIVRGDSGFCREPLKSWSRERRVIGKAEMTEGKSNPRYIVTDITGAEDWAQASTELSGSGQSLNEQSYCARGDMEPSGAR